MFVNTEKLFQKLHSYFYFATTYKSRCPKQYGAENVGKHPGTCCDPGPRLHFSVILFNFLTIYYTPTCSVTQPPDYH